MTITHSLLAVFFALLLWAPIGAAPATAQARTVDDVVEVSWLPGYRLSDTRHMAAIRIALAPGWKTYWRAPGEGGVPTALRLTRAEGISGMAIHWPRPRVFVVNGLRSIGYDGVVTLPVEFAVSPGQDGQISGRLDFGVCQDVCMPVSIDLSGTLPAAGARDGSIAAALSDRPLTASEVGAGRAQCQITPIADGLQVTVSVPIDSAGRDETLVLEHRDPMIWVSEARTWREGGRLIGVADVVPADNSPFALNRADLRVTVIGQRMAVDLGACHG